jgi:hypothetical protein
MTFKELDFELGSACLAPDLIGKRGFSHSSFRAGDSGRALLWINSLFECTAGGQNSHRRYLKKKADPFERIDLAMS